MCHYGFHIKKPIGLLTASWIRVLTNWMPVSEPTMLVGHASSMIKSHLFWPYAQLSKKPYMIKIHFSVKSSLKKYTDIVNFTQSIHHMAIAGIGGPSFFLMLQEGIKDISQTAE